MNTTTPQRLALNNKLEQLKGKQWTEEDRIEVQKLLEAAVRAEPPTEHTVRRLTEELLMETVRAHKQLGMNEFSMIVFLRERWPL